MDKAPDAFRTISEVAEALETPAHVLRFWESRFPQIKPVKRAGGRRYYRPADVALLAGIRHMLHVDGMTIRGVQKVLREQGVRHVAALGGADVSQMELETDTGDLAEGAMALDVEPVAQIVPFDSMPRRTPDRPAGAGASVQPLFAPTESLAPPETEPGFIAFTTPRPRDRHPPAAEQATLPFDAPLADRSASDEARATPFAGDDAAHDVPMDVFPSSARDDDHLESGASAAPGVATSVPQADVAEADLSTTWTLAETITEIVIETDLAYSFATDAAPPGRAPPEASASLPEAAVTDGDSTAPDVGESLTSDASTPDQSEGAEAAALDFAGVHLSAWPAPETDADPTLLPDLSLLAASSDDTVTHVLEPAAPDSGATDLSAFDRPQRPAAPAALPEVALASVAPRLRALSTPPARARLSSDTRQHLTELHSRLGLLHAQMAEALRLRR
jgi:DNA-binding transcriptional MerR regulator